MKISKSSLSACLFIVVALSAITLMRVSAEDVPITDQQVTKIRDNCLSTKNTLNQLHASDALLRVNMGQIYESMSTKLMSGFNGRVSNNKYDNMDFVSIKNSYDSALNSFRRDYKTYEEHLSLAIGIDCSKQPVSFYDAVALARTQRVKVHDDILKLNQYVDQYKSAIDQFEKDHFTPIDGIRN